MLLPNFIFLVGRLAKTALFSVFVALILGATAIISSAQDEDKPVTPDPPVVGAAAESGNYLEDTPNLALKDNSSKLKPCYQGGSFIPPATPQLLAEYFQDYEFKLWTLKKNATKLTSWRKELRTNCVRAKAGPVHDRLNEVVLEVLSKKVKNRKYAPVFLVNAMMAIGELNSVEGSNPTPLPQALPVLLETLGDAQQLDAVKVAALNGIKRHVVSGVKDPTIAKAVFKLASTEDSEVAKAWMRAQAIEILGFLSSPGQNNQVINLLQSIIADKKATLRLRCTAAEALGQINLSNAAGVKADALISALAQLMKDGCDEQLKIVKDKDIAISPRAMKSYLSAVVAGLGDASKSLGVASLKDAASANKITAILKILNKELLPKLDSEESTDEDLQKAVETAQKNLGAYNSRYQNESKVLPACAARPPAVNRRENLFVLLHA
jgi:hypothetical protein